MAHNTIKIILTGLIIFINANTVSASNHSSHSVKVIHSKERTEAQPVNTQEPVANPKGRGLSGHEQAPMEKKAKPATEELAHIHHFHKERVKKLKQHHQKCWIASKLILILCHLALLVIAYSHIGH